MNLPWCSERIEGENLCSTKAHAIKNATLFPESCSGKASEASQARFDSTGAKLLRRGNEQNVERIGSSIYGSGKSTDWELRATTLGER